MLGIGKSMRYAIEVLGGTRLILAIIPLLAHLSEVQRSSSSDLAPTS
jgi:hypothetical protein